jgi:thiopeptide-type bacteriocin biosynthesis protein
MSTAGSRPKRPVAASGFFVMRTPLLPLATFFEVVDTTSEPEVLARLHRLCALPEIRAGLALASPALAEPLERWLAGGSLDQPLVPVLLRYLARMCGRSTPFGLFAGYTVGRLGPVSELRLAPRASYRRHTELHSAYMFAFWRQLLAAPRDDPQTRWRPNETLYPLGAELRYLAAAEGVNDRNCRLESVETTPELRRALAVAEQGASAAEITRALVSGDVDGDDAATYVAQLINAQILVPALGVTLTGPAPTRAFVQTIGAYAPESAARLAHAVDQLAALDAAPITVAPIVDAAALLPEAYFRPSAGGLLRVDLNKPAEAATLRKDVIDELVRGLDLVVRLAPPREDRLASFRAAFVTKFGDAEVPLLQALDEDAGVGLENPAPSRLSPLVDGIALVAESDSRLTDLDTALLRLAERALRTGAASMEIGAADLPPLAGDPWQRLPAAFSVMGSLAASSAEALRQGRFRVLVRGVTGPSGANMLARFCAADPELEALVRDHLAAEEATQPDCLFAEIVHCPDVAIANVVFRPHLRAHELEFLGRSGAPRASVIPLSDVRVRVAGAKVRLRSARLGVELVPRMTNAHNYTLRTLTVYEFLCRLQHQDGGPAFFSWRAAEGFSSLPRLTAGRLVLAPARWRLTRAELRPALDARDAEARAARMRTLCEARGLPRRAAVEVGDEQGLPVDLHSPWSVDVLRSLARDGHDVVLWELFPELDELAVEGPEGRFTNELLIPFVRTQQQPPARARPTTAPAVEPASASPQLPGGAWWYAKLYCGAASADRVLPPIAALAERLVREDAIDCWFFVRYLDPEPHLRVRLHGAPGDHGARAGAEMLRLARDLAGDALVWRVQIDTYQPEVNRYGGPGALPLVEQVFGADSVAAAAIVAAVPAGERWRACLVGIDALLRDAGLSLASRRDLVQHAAGGFARELTAEGGLEAKLGGLYRAHGRASAQLLAGGGRSLAIDRILEERARRVKPLLAAIRARPDLTAPWEDIVASLIHMHVNRVMASEPRKHEAVLYDFLRRIYATELACRAPAATTGTSASSN